MMRAVGRPSSRELTSAPLDTSRAITSPEPGVRLSNYPHTARLQRWIRGGAVLGLRMSSRRLDPSYSARCYVNSTSFRYLDIYLSILAHLSWISAAIPTPTSSPETQRSTMSQSPDVSVLVQLASDIHKGKLPETIFKSLENALAALFGYNLFTVFVYDAKSSTISRVYSTRQDVQPVGTRKKVTSSPWAQLVLKDGQMYLGSTVEDMKVFSEYEFLATIGCESVLNVPIRSSLSGEIIGALALLGEPHKYDDADQGLAAMVAVLVAGAVEAARDEILSRPFDSANMETV